MKLLLRLLLLVMIGSAYAQSNLPACNGSGPNGSGTLYISNWTNCFGTGISNIGEKYVGEWKNGRFNGKGVFYYADGSTRQGIWADGNLILSESFQQFSISQSGLPTPLQNYETRTLNDGTIEQGIFKKNCPIWSAWCVNVMQGNGKRVYPSGEIEEGYFDNGQLTGKGKVIKSTKEIIEGDFKNGLANGLVVVTDRLGKKKTVFYSNGIETDVLPVQQLGSPTNEIAKLRAEAEEAKRKNAEQEQLRLSQNQSPSLPVTASFMGKRLALVIGNQSYNVRPLLNPRNDADDMSRALKNAGFEVIDVRDASLSQMRNAVRQFGDRLLTRDVGLVYYSGHGIEVRGRNYFIPVNADIKRSDEIADQSLDVNLILEKMETAKKGVNILIVDACRDDPFGRSFRSSSRGLANMDAPQGTIIAFATSPGKVAADGEGRNSPYTKNLIKTMQIPNLPIEQVFKQVRRAVQQETKNQQTPWENTSLSGDFYFSVKK